MAHDYSEYSHIKVYLSEVLSELDSGQEELTRTLLRVGKDTTEDSAKQQIGVIQGFNMALKKLERTFGAA